MILVLQYIYSKQYNLICNNIKDIANIASMGVWAYNQTYSDKMADHVNLCDNEIEGNSEIASEENNKDNEEESDEEES